MEAETDLADVKQHFTELYAILEACQGFPPSVYNWII